MGIFGEKAVIVTGGASGIGRAVSEELARRGAYVTLADVNTELLEETATSITNAGGRAKPVALDVTDPDAVKKVVDDTVAEFGKLDYIFNNAGVVVFGEAHRFPLDDWRKIIDTNLYGVVHGVAAAYPIMVKQGFGHIINTASLAGLVPATGLIPYVASKYGVVGISNALRIEGADYGVKASVVCPGLIDTGMKNSKLIDLDREKALEASPKLLPAEECARVILKGVERNKGIIVVTGGAKFFWLLQRVSPALTRSILRVLHRRMLRLVRTEE
jgi:NAD(P)-dependent dehydrogenase (short-subunit alcohol dehydrogenase family)